MSVRSRWRSSAGVLLAVLALAALAGCDLKPPPPEITSTPPPAIVEKGTITIATAADRPPMVFKDKASGEIVGADRELMDALAAAWGVKLRVVEAPRDQLLDLVATGKADLAMGALPDTVGDRTRVSFVDYFRSGVRLYTTAAHGAAYPSAASVCGKSVAVSTDDDDKRVAAFGIESCAPIARPAIERVRASSAAAARQQLDAGRVDLVAQNAESYAYLIKSHSGQYSGVLDPLETDHYAVAVRNSDLELTTALVIAIQNLRQDYTYTTILRRWYLEYGEMHPMVNGR